MVDRRTSARNSRTPLSTTRSILASERFQQALQVALGIGISTLVTFVPSLRFPGSCLTTILFLISSVLYTTQPYIGAKMHAGALMASSSALAALTAGATVAAARGISHSGAIPYIPALCVLSALGLVPFSVLRTHLPLAAPAVIATFLYGMTVMRARFIEPPSSIWGEAVLPVFGAGALAGALVVLSGMLLLPVLAYTAMLGEVSSAAMSLGQSISWFTTTLWDGDTEREPELVLRPLAPDLQASSKGDGTDRAGLDATAAKDGVELGLMRGGSRGDGTGGLSRQHSGSKLPSSFLSRVDQETGSPQRGAMGKEFQEADDEEGEEDENEGVGPEDEDDDEDKDDVDVTVRVVDALPSRLLKPQKKPRARGGFLSAIKTRSWRKGAGKGQAKPSGAHPPQDRVHKLPQADACRLWPVLDRTRELLSTARREPPCLFPWRRGLGPVSRPPPGPSCRGPCGGEVWTQPACELDAWQRVVGQLDALQSAVVSLAVVFEGGHRRFSSRTLWRWLGEESQANFRLVFAAVAACCHNVARDVRGIHGGRRRRRGGGEDGEDTSEHHSVHMVHTRRQTFTEDREPTDAESSARLVREMEMLASTAKGSLGPLLRSLQARLSRDMVDAYKAYWASLQGSGSKCPINEVHALLYAMTISHSVIEAAIALEDAVEVAASYRGPKAVVSTGWGSGTRSHNPPVVRVSIAEEELQNSLRAAHRAGSGIPMTAVATPALATGGDPLNATWPPRSPRTSLDQRTGSGAQDGHSHPMDALTPREQSSSPRHGSPPPGKAGQGPPGKAGQGPPGKAGQGPPGKAGQGPPVPGRSPHDPSRPRHCRPSCSRGTQSSRSSDSTTFLRPLVEALLLVPFLRHLAYSTRTLVTIGRAQQRGGGLGGLLRGRLFQFGFKYWLVCALFLVAVLAVGPEHRGLVDRWNAIWVFVTVTIVMMPKVEATVFKAVLRIIATVSGATLGYLFMMSEPLAGCPAALAALLFVVALVSCYHIDCPYRYAVYLFVETVNLVVLCQYMPPRDSLAAPCIQHPRSTPTTEGGELPSLCGGTLDTGDSEDGEDGSTSDRTGSFTYAASRAVTIVVGSLVSVIWGNTFLPWYASSQARVCLSRALVESARLYACLWDDFLSTAAKCEAALPRSPPALDTGSAPASPRQASSGGASLPSSPRSGGPMIKIPSTLNLRDVASPSNLKTPSSPTVRSPRENPWAATASSSPRSAGSSTSDCPRGPPLPATEATPRQASFTGAFTGVIRHSPESPSTGSAPVSPRAPRHGGSPVAPGAAPAVVATPLAVAAKGGVLRGPGAGVVGLGEPAGAPQEEVPAALRQSALSDAALALGTGSVRQHLDSVSSILRAESVYWRRGVLIMPPLMSEAAAALTKLANRLTSLRLIGGAPPRLTGVYTGHGVHLFAQLLRSEIREVLVATHELVQITARRLRDPEDRVDRLPSTLARPGVGENGVGGPQTELGQLRAWWRRRKARHGVPSGSYYVVENAAANNQLCLQGLLGAIQRLEDARDVFWKRYRSLRMGLHMDMKTAHTPELLNVDDIFLLKSWQFAHMAFLDKVTLVAREVAAADGEVEPSWLIILSRLRTAWT
eukprot:jgi/Mesvir1/6426/Mv19513-RA.1